MLKPLLNDVLVEEQKQEETIKAGIIIPEAQGHKKKHPIGKVVAVGPGTKDSPMTIKIGDEVMHRAGGYDISIKEGDFKLINSTLILGVMEE